MGLTDEDSAESCRTAANAVANFIAVLMASRKARTINRKVSVLRAFFQWAEDTQRIGRLAIPKISQVPVVQQQSRKMRILSEREQSQLLKVVVDAKEERACALLTLMLHTGLRISQLRMLRWRDINLEGPCSTIRIRSSKSGREVLVTLDATTVEAINWLRGAASPLPEAPVFPGRSGPLTRSQIANVLERYFSAAGIKDSRPEMLRITFEANMIRRGTDPYTLAYLMGYSRLGLPQKRYSSMIEVLGRDAARRKPRSK